MISARLMRASSVISFNLVIIRLQPSMTYSSKSKVRDWVFFRLFPRLEANSLRHLSVMLWHLITEKQVESIEGYSCKCNSISLISLRFLLRHIAKVLAVFLYELSPTPSGNLLFGYKVDMHMLSYPWKDSLNCSRQSRSLVIKDSFSRISRVMSPILFNKCK